MPGTLLGRDALWFDSYKRPPPVSDHSVFAFWVVAYRRFNCSLFVFLVASFVPSLCLGAHDATRATMPDKSLPPPPPPAFASPLARLLFTTFPKMESLLAGYHCNCVSFFHRILTKMAKLKLKQTLQSLMNKCSKLSGRWKIKK